ncbi:MAG: hypothetical protein HC788_13300 [Sphingopyxis sp.]|nr:hypothetical protein [Sphingopyxis sp.]
MLFNLEAGRLKLDPRTVVVLDEAHPKVPQGLSIWELGVSADPKRKADADYQKRKLEQPASSVGPVDPASTTFVFVSLRRWNAKTEWLQARQAERFWLDVRVLDADDLEAWLEQAPATHVWLSCLLGRRPEGADDLEACWLDWSASTSPPLSPGLMFAGRETALNEIRQWFTAPERSTLGVESESPEETLALVAAFGLPALAQTNDGFGLERGEYAVGFRLLMSKGSCIVTSNRRTSSWWTMTVAVCKAA